MQVDKLLTVVELAERLGISPGTLYHWLSEGRVTAIRFSKRCVRFRESDVQKLLDDLSNCPSKSREAVGGELLRLNPSRTRR
jgi:excisionase family DNA binding protein